MRACVCACTLSVCFKTHGKMKQTAFNEIRGSERWDIINLYDFQVHKFIRMYIYSRVREITRSQFLSLEPSPICTLSDVTGTGSKGCPRLNQIFISLTVLFENGDDFKLLRVVHTGRALFKSYSRINHVSSKFALEERHSIILKHVWSICVQKNYIQLFGNFHRHHFDEKYNYIFDNI